MREDIEKMLREEGWTRLANGNWRAPDDSEQASDRERRIEAGARAWRERVSPTWTPTEIAALILDAADKAVPMVSLADIRYVRREGRQIVLPRVDDLD